MFVLLWYISHSACRDIHLTVQVVVEDPVAGCGHACYRVTCLHGKRERKKGCSWPGARTPTPNTVMKITHYFVIIFCFWLYTTFGTTVKCSLHYFWLKCLGLYFKFFGFLLKYFLRFLKSFLKICLLLFIWIFQLVEF